VYDEERGSNVLAGKRRQAMPVPTTLPPELGHYRILRQIGAGGMGTVYLAEDTQLNRRVAIKVPHFREDEGPEGVKRFYQEAELARTIHHPYICPVYDVGEAAGFHYLTMPFIEGTPLNKLIGPKHEWMQRRAAELVRRVALALESLHKLQVIHRDLKPHNIMVCANDEPMLMDFGLARSLKAGQQRLTSTGETLGTPAYMSPEQITADPDALCPATDVYSLGVILYEIVTGRTPFHADNLWSLFNEILNTPPPPPRTHRPDLADELDAICSKALAKVPEKRFPSMAELALALSGYLNRSAQRKEEPPAPAPPPPSQADHRYETRQRKEEPPAPPPPPPLVSPPPRRPAFTAPRRVTVPSPPPSGTTPPQPLGDIISPCPKCGRKLKLPAALWGRKARCPQCQAILRVPEDVVVPETLADVHKPSDTSPTPRPVRELMNPLGMRFLWMAPGTFLMGSPPQEMERSSDETLHRVTLTRGFFLCAYPVTQTQWQAIMGRNPSRSRGDNRPVENVSWEDCEEFCRKLSELEGKVYRLPTEAEWEYACRAGTTTPFCTGPTISTNQANYDGNWIYGEGKKGVYRKATTPVDSFPPNGWGLFDMHGNVWEWCSDWYAEYLDGDVTDPQGPASGTERVLRGGSWVYGPRGARSACRERHSPTFKAHDAGCRVCFTSD
jgi:formylglycine-generating enzyme required for sulfatase activity